MNNLCKTQDEGKRIYKKRCFWSVANILISIPAIALLLFFILNGHFEPMMLFYFAVPVLLIPIVNLHVNMDLASSVNAVLLCVAFFTVAFVAVMSLFFLLRAMTIYL